MKTQILYSEMKALLQKAGVEDAGFEAEILIRHITKKGRFDEYDITCDEVQNIKCLLDRRVNREPLQYILGTQPFLDLELSVGEGVLVPRFDTEEVCLAAADTIKHKKYPVVLDLCSGSGALALGVQSLCKTADVTAIEKSEDAFFYLEKNVSAFKEEKKPSAVKGDVFTFHEQVMGNSVDLIVCNPPYVTEEEYSTLQPEVLAEPKLALVAQDDGLCFYKAIARDYFKVLVHGGWMVFEIGSKQGKALSEILQNNGYTSVKIKKDMSENDRIAIGQKPEKT